MPIMKSVRKKRDLPITGLMAKWYDKNTRQARLEEMGRYADIVEANAPKGASVLEVAPGPGYLSIDLSRRGFAVTGVDLSADFVQIARRNADEAHVQVDFRQGNADSLPIGDESVDFIVCSAAFKNFKEPLRALEEMYRVLAIGGRALIIDMNREHTKEDVEEELKKSPGMKGFDRWFVKLSFNTFLKSGAYTKGELEGLIAQTPFAGSEIVKHGIGFLVWLRK